MELSPSEIARSVAQLERRVAALESVLAGAGGPFPDAAHLIRATVDPSSTARSEPSTFGGPDLVTIPALVGRTFLALAGAYLLRALTDSGVLNPQVGVTAGLAYGALWLALADRAAPGSRASAGFHGVVASLVGFPVVWEATMKFGLLTPVMSAFLLAVLITGGLLVAVHRCLYTVAWTIVVIGGLTAAALIPATDGIVPFAVVLIALGVGTLWIGYVYDWLILRWPAAAVADFAVIGVTFRVATQHGVEGPAAALALQVLLIAGYLVSIIVRTLVRGRDVIPFEVVQGILALVVGLGGAVTIARAATAGTIAVGMVTLLLSVACYATAFVFIATRQGERANFYFYTTLALMLMLSSAHLLLVSPPLTVALSLLTVSAAIVAATHGPRFIVTHAFVYGIAAALASGLLLVASFRLTESPAVEWPAFAWPMVAALAAIVACEAIPLPKRGGVWDFWSHLPRLGLLVLTMWGGAGVVIELIARALAGRTTTIDAGALATIRTVVISGAALAFARIGQLPAYREMRWVVYPLLLGGGVKLLMEDLPRSRPATLFVAFAAYGVAMLVAPRLLALRAEKAAASEASAVAHSAPADVEEEEVETI